MFENWKPNGKCSNGGHESPAPLWPKKAYIKFNRRVTEDLINIKPNYTKQPDQEVESTWSSVKKWEWTSLQSNQARKWRALTKNNMRCSFSYESLKCILPKSENVITERHPSHIWPTFPKIMVSNDWLYTATFRWVCKWNFVFSIPM